MVFCLSARARYLFLRLSPNNKKIFVKLLVQQQAESLTIFKLLSHRTITLTIKVEPPSCLDVHKILNTRVRPHVFLHYKDRYTLWGMQLAL